MNGDLPTGEVVLRDYINATVGFNDLEVLPSSEE